MNSVTNAMRAHILTAAVPYIKQYTDKYVVVKYGGNAMTDPELKKSVMNEFASIAARRGESSPRSRRWSRY